MNIASFKLLDRKKIPNVSPLSAARQMLQDPIDFHFAGGSSYYEQMNVAIKYFAENKGAKNCPARCIYLPILARKFKPVPRTKLKKWA